MNHGVRGLGAEQVATIGDPSRVDYVKANGEFKLELIYRVARQNDPAKWRFKNEELEAKVSRVLGEYLAPFADPTGRPRVRIDGKNAALKRLFCGAEWVPKRALERKVRRLIAMQGDEADLPHRRGDDAGEVVRLMGIAISEIDRWKVEGRLEVVLKLPGQGDGKILGD